MNWSTSFRAALAASSFAIAAIAQDDSFEQLSLRISTLRPNGAFVIDRGQNDLVQVGDRVVLTPRNGAAVPGTVIEVGERTSVVEVVDRSAVLPIGTKGHVLVPRARRAVKPVETPTVPPPNAEPPPPRKDAGEEEEWKPGMPLLGTTRAPRPEERKRTMTGRVYIAADVVRTLDSWSHSYLDTGLDFEVDNPRGNDGGTLFFHGAFNWSTEAASERSGTDIRLYEVGYEHGGTRFTPLHWQVGRFLPREMPEFGLLDGGAIGYRREGGDRVGASFGWLPELDEDLESFGDMQVAAWYVWNADITERVSWGLGYQKTWHRFDQDRDLVVVKWRYLPAEGWTFASTVWIDFYTGRDELKDRDIGLTRGNAFVSRRWQGSGGIDLSWDHEEYPDILRRELPQTLTPITLADAHQDRLSFHAFTTTGSVRWFTRLTGWTDEERDGGAVEVGFEVDDMLGKGARTVIAGFDVQGLTNDVLGARIEQGATYGWGRLDLLGEVGFVHHQGFPDNRDDLLQYRFGAIATTDLGSGWDGIFHADVTLWDDDSSFAVGVYLQRHF